MLHLVNDTLTSSMGKNIIVLGNPNHVAAKSGSARSITKLGIV